MTQFNLKTAFTQEQLGIFYATGTNVIVGKSSDGRQPSVAWQVFRPMQANTLSWKEEYGIYASTSDIKNGTILRQLSSTPIGSQLGGQYTLQSYGNITGPSGGGSQNAFLISNQYGDRPYMTTGLYQNAAVNGGHETGNAISANRIPMQSNLMMTPSTTLFIWLQSQVVSNSVVTNVTSPMTELKFGGNVTDISITYDSNTGRFVPAKSSTLKSTPESFNYIEPSL